MKIMLVVFGALVAATVGGPPAAAVEYPWCAYYGFGSGGTNCGFVTMAQCMASVSGTGGTCSQNPRYEPSTERYPRHRYHSRDYDDRY
jgi:hypothetical protein